MPNKEKEAKIVITDNEKCIDSFMILDEYTLSIFITRGNYTRGIREQMYSMECETCNSIMDGASGIIQTTPSRLQENQGNLDLCKPLRLSVSPYGFH